MAPVEGGRGAASEKHPLFCLSGGRNAAFPHLDSEVLLSVAEEENKF